MISKNISASNELESHSEAVTVYDMTKTNPDSKGFTGALFDGQFIYFIPWKKSKGTFFGQVTRYNTQGSFTDTQSWEVYDTTKVDVNSKGFTNGSFDGRFLYLSPYHNGKHHSGQVTRYDTQSSFTSVQSWAVYDTTQVHTNSRGFTGSVFDGRYVYFVPFQIDGTTSNGQVTRYDTQGNFTSLESWEVYDTTQIHVNSKGFHMGFFDGRYIYFVPYLLLENGVYNGQVTRYDTIGNFNSASSWEVYDTTAINANSKGFFGAISDGRYIYFIPYNNGNHFGQITRYDTKGSFVSAQSWDFYDTTQVHANSKGFFDAVFDGRYIYFVPHCKAPSVFHGQVTRYDTKGSFTSTQSWKIYDTTQVHANSKGFIGGVFDGKFLYLAPYETEADKQSGLVTRIDINTSSIWK
ncbi:MAG: hypothetical protein ABFS56_01280 [Pseudomonadota bacterium]